MLKPYRKAIPYEIDSLASSQLGQCRSRRTARRRWNFYAKFGCGIGLCGACVVHIDGKPARSCLTPVSSVSGKGVATIEGISGKVAEAVQTAWQQLDVVQCGYCQSGQIMSAIALLNGKSKPTDADIENAMDGNICRCATYIRIRAAIHEASRMLG